MNDDHGVDVGLTLVSHLSAIGADDRALRRGYASGDLFRVRRGAYVSADINRRATTDDRYLVRIAAVLGTRRAPLVLSHYSAARIWGLPIIGAWPLEVHATEDPGSMRRSKNGVIIHRHSAVPGDIEEHRGVLLTGIERTLVDLARIADFRDAVCAIDRALHDKRVTKVGLLNTLGRLGAVNGSKRAFRAIAFASSLSDSPGETWSRVLMMETGFPAPELQHPVSLSNGRVLYLDFWWEHIGLAGEFDGRAKYFDPGLTKGASFDEILWKEKKRENELRDAGVTSLARWTWSDLQPADGLISRLELHGLHRVLPGGFARTRSGG